MQHTPTTSPNIIGNNIKYFREKLGLKQDVIAKYLQTSREQISYYEIGSRIVNTEHLGKLASLFCINEYDLYETNAESNTINIAFAFRAESLNNEDLTEVAKFKKLLLIT